jgi:hypothetical protein
MFRSDGFDHVAFLHHRLHVPLTYLANICVSSRFCPGLRPIFYKRHRIVAVGTCFATIELRAQDHP